MTMGKRLGCAAAFLLTGEALLAQSSPAREFVVHVNEPFFTVETAGDTVRITSPDDLEGTIVPAQRLEIGGVIQVAGTYVGEPFVVTIVEAACEDDMSGLPYSHSAALALGTTLTPGCARLSTEPQPQEGG